MAKGVSELESFLRERGVKYEIVDVGDAWSSRSAAAAVGVGLESVAKTVVFVGDGDAVLVVVPGDCRVDQRSLARMLGYRRLRLARREEVVEATGYEPGSVPPVGHAGRCRVVVDRRILGRGWVYAGGGSPRHLLRIRGADIAALSGGEVLEVPCRGV